MKGRNRKLEEEVVSRADNPYLRRMFECLEEGVCPFCEKKVNFEDFENVGSINEYGLSGLCQKCQNSFFSKDLKNE